ncbi:ExbD/TolR family protein [Moheibacter lacus]|uniref:Biopolymer transporter ExbD n=1 Tax=Moheibacter lacus TaxID=2745851 RepID=A0A838ZS85_9FLAO|nr:biopolymer transporter ExbD [Moheibacter lacus]MBA5629833.1 biopolymer transporter ExbD [Moheibacter lacus]
MARVKPKRQGIHMDMTAMSDMAWLLLTFFILTTQFKKPDIVPIKTPSSVAETKIQDGDLIRITINNEGKYYFSIIDDKNKLPILEKMGQKYGITFTDAEKSSFMKLSEIPVPVRSLKQYLNLNDGQKQATIPGIPMDSTDLQLIDWVDFSFEHDPELKLAIKGDVNTQYPEFRDLIKQLVERDFNRFQLVTSSESKPKD